jgi:L-galactose dehydrogenase
MKHNRLGQTGLNISQLSFGASSLGGVFHEVDEIEGVATVHSALEAGINYFDVAPAYGGGRSEIVLGRALKGIDRSRYSISTKVGKYTHPDQYGKDTLDYSRGSIRRSVEKSAAAIGVDYFDIIYLHDIEYLQREHTEWALTEGMETVHELKKEGRIGAVGVGIYPMDLWHRIVRDYPIDVALVHNHYCLNDTRLVELLPIAEPRGIGIINASPFASGLLTDCGAPEWHPASQTDRASFQKAADYCAAHDTSISKLAIQFSSQHPSVATTMFSTANRASLASNLGWLEEPFDASLVAQVQAILLPVTNKDYF